MRVVNQSKGALLASQATLAKTIFSRFKGLLGQPSLPEQNALIIPDCRSIHMFFMRFSIDVIFADRNHRIVGLVKNIGPFCLSPYFWKAYYAIELPAGKIHQTRSEVGDRLSFEG